jgi:hypothetical protein
MIEQIKDYLIPTACFLLLILLVFLLLERYKKSIRVLLARYPRIQTKISRDKVIKGFIAGALILFLRKVVYYIPSVGIIQTKYSICWVHEHVMTYLLLFMVGFIILSIALILSITLLPIDEFILPVLSFFIFFLAILTFVLSDILEVNLPADFGKIPPNFQFFHQILLTLLSTPLLMLKMLCGGKYLGFLTGFVVGYFIIEKFNPQRYWVKKKFLKFLAALGFILLVFFTFFVFKFSRGDLEKRFTDKVQAAKSEEKVMELLEAANSLLDKNHKENALKEIAVAAAKTGNIEWALDIAKTLHDPKIKNDAIEEIQQIRGNKKEK